MIVNEAVGAIRPAPTSPPPPAAPTVRSFTRGQDRVTLSGAGAPPAAAPPAIPQVGIPSDGEPTDPDRHGPLTPGDHERTSTISFYA